MATEWVTRNRIDRKPLETVPEPFARRAEPRNRETARKKLPEPWNRRKKMLEPDQRTTGRFTQTTGSKEPPRNHDLDRTGWTGPTVPRNRNRNRAGWTGPTIPWNRTRNRAVHPGPAVLWNRPKTSRWDFLYKYTTISIIFIHNSSLLLLSLLNFFT